MVGGTKQIPLRTRISREFRSPNVSSSEPKFFRKYHQKGNRVNVRNKVVIMDPNNRSKRSEPSYGWAMKNPKLKSHERCEDTERVASPERLSESAHTRSREPTKGMT